jgi:UV DNA damage endonuclease
MKIGYPCIHLSLPCRSSRTFRLASYSEERMHITVKNNLECLMSILEFNVKNNLLFFRITSDLIPFASHPACKFPWQKEFKKNFRKIGNFIIKHKIRVTMHPDQFTLINSPDRGIFNRSVRELRYHSDVLDLLGI